MLFVRDMKSSTPTKKKNHKQILIVIKFALLFSSKWIHINVKVENKKLGI